MAAVVIPSYSIVPSNVAVTPIQLSSRLTATASTTSLPCTSSTDDDILSYLLSPSLQHGPLVRSSEVMDDELGGAGLPIADTTLAALRAMQNEGICAADDERYNDAVRTFSDMVALCPHYAPAYNNRAQCYLLMQQHDGEALADLNASIEYAHTDRLTLRQSLTQRGMLHRKQGRDDEARADFTMGARLGSGVCREQLVVMNPYAAMCNAMLARAMTELREGRDDERESEQSAVTPAS